MRIIICLLFIFLSGLPVLSQDKRPSEKEVQEQLKQAMADAKQNVAELKIQIADAKLNKEDPASIQQMEQQLGIMEKTVVMLEKTNFQTRPTSLPAVKTVLPKYVSPIISINLKQPIVAPTKAQAKDTLLWYHGKKLNDSMLVTIQSTVVLYSRRRNMVIVQPDKKKDSTLINIAVNLAKCRQWTNQYIDNLAATKNSFFYYPQIISNLEEFKHIEDAYYNIAKNTINLPSPGNSISAVPAQNNTVARGPFTDFDTGPANPDDFLKVLHRDMVDYMNGAGPINMGMVPQEFPPYCEFCNGVPDRHGIIMEWQTEFLQFEIVLLAKMSGIKIWMADKNISAAASGIPTIQQDLRRALDMAFERWDEKVDRLESFGMKYMGIVIENLLLLQSQKKMYHGVVDDSYTTRAKNKLNEYKNLIAQEYEDLMARKIYDQALDDKLIAAFNRHYKLLFGGNNAEPLMSVVNKIKAFNRFSLTIDLAFTIEQRGTDNKLIVEADGKLSNKDKVYVSLGKAGNCKWQLFLTNTDYTKQDENSFRIPIIAKQGTKYTYEKNPVNYTGPADLLMVFPYTKMNFCNIFSLGTRDPLNRNLVHPPPPDTLIVDVVRYKAEDLSGYRPGPQQYSVDFLAYVNKIFASYEMAYSNSLNLVTTAYAMMNAAFLHGKVDQPTGYPKLDIMQVDFKMNGIQLYHQQMLSNTTHFPNTLMFIKPANGKPELVGVDRNVSNTEARGVYNLRSGDISIRVIHDPQ